MAVEKSLDELNLENEALRGKISQYEKNLGKIKTPLPSSTPIDHHRLFLGTHLKIALLGDTHFGSKYERLRELDAAYKMIDEEGITTVYHQGDITDGSHHMHPGMAYEQRCHGVMEQVGHVAKEYPLLDKVKTYFISGNHDDSFLKADGVEIGLLIAQRRQDLVYLGQEEADVKLPGGVIYRIRHGSGGGSYAKSYRLQRTIDSLQPEDRPDLLSQGHLHTAFYMRHSGVETFQVPAFQGQSLYLKSRGLQPVVGMWLLEFTASSGRISRMKPELITFDGKQKRRAA